MSSCKNCGCVPESCFCETEGEAPNSIKEEVIFTEEQLSDFAQKKLKKIKEKMDKEIAKATMFLQKEKEQ